MLDYLNSTNLLSRVLRFSQGIRLISGSLLRLFMTLHGLAVDVLPRFVNDDLNDASAFYVLDAGPET